MPITPVSAAATAFRSLPYHRMPITIGRRRGAAAHSTDVAEPAPLRRGSTIDIMC